MVDKNETDGSYDLLRKSRSRRRGTAAARTAASAEGGRTQARGEAGEG